MKYSDVPLNDTVKTWNTKVLQVLFSLTVDKPNAETQRHPDQARVLGGHVEIPEHASIKVTEFPLVRKF